MSPQNLIGKPAPAITLTNYDGETFTFTPGEKGIPTAVLFYPESGSFGCTKQMCQFRDKVAEKPNFKPEKVQIIGVSPNTVEQQKAFVEKEKLTNRMLTLVHTVPSPCRSKKEVAKAYGVGKGMMGMAAVARVTFIVDKKGIVRDALDATMNYGAHTPFVEKWLAKLEEEDKSEPTPTTTAPPPEPEPTPEDEGIERCARG